MKIYTKLMTRLILFLVVFTLFSGVFIKEIRAEENNPVLYIGLMVHLEGYNLSNDQVYENYKSNIIDLAGTFNEYDAKLTLEVKELIDACDNRNDNFLKLLEDRGHAIGVHADAGGVPSPGEKWQDISKVMKTMKQKLEKQDLNIRHVSGYCSPLDWVSAVTESGFSFVTGGVTWCLQSLPKQKIPEEFLSCSNPAECHSPYPTTFKERLHPWTIRKNELWTEHHIDGQLVFMPNAVESLPYLSEKEADPEFMGKPAFDERDITLYIQKLEDALEQADPQKPNFAYAGWSYGIKMPEPFARKWLEAIKPYIQSGKVQWKTIPEMYDIYINWRVVPDIKVNNSNSPIDINTGENLTISLSLNPGENGNEDHDFWLCSFSDSGWQSLVLEDNQLIWKDGIQRCVKMPIIEFSELKISQPKLTKGENTIFFAIDNNADNQPDATWWDYIIINIQDP